MRSIFPHIERVLQGETVEFEKRIHLKTVGTRVFSAVYTPQRNSLKKLIGFIASISDITEQKTANALARSMTLQIVTDRSTTSSMSALIRAKDWSNSPLGDADGWPPSLTLVVNLVLASGFPMAVRWGPDFVMIYNDGYRPILGDKHPQALGLPFREVWPEVQTVLAPLHESILSGERSAFFAEDLLLENSAAWLSMGERAFYHQLQSNPRRFGSYRCRRGAYHRC